MDRILVRDLLVRCIVGLRDEERREKQDVTINLDLYADLAKACRTDRVEDTFDYSALKKRILAMVEESSFFLIEALAEAIARICLEELRIRKVGVQVEKPSALRFARSVGVRIVRKRDTRAPYRAFIALGSNIEPEDNIREAIRQLAECEQVVAVSTVYRSPAEGRPEQSPFYNCIVEIETATPPLELKLRVLRRIESELGRRRGPDKYAPRTIDLDLIAYADLAIDTPGLTLPDPQIADRPFLTVPLSELAPDLMLPNADRTIRDIAAAFPQSQLEPLLTYTQLLREGLRRKP